MEMPNSRSADVAVVGAAGTTGVPLVQALVRRGARVRAIIHSGPQADRVGAAAEVLAVEIDDGNALAAALRGADVVHFIPPVFNSAEAHYGAQVLAAAAAAGARRVGYHSVLHPATPAMPHHLRKSQVELL